MIMSERLLVLLVVLCSVVLCENKKGFNRQGRHFLALLGYLHGYKIGQEYALQIPQYLITPIVIVPSVNQQQSVNIQQASNDENYQEIGNTIQKVVPVKIISAVDATTIKEEDVKEQLNDEIEVTLPMTLNSKLNANNSNKIANVTDSPRQGMTNDANKTASENNTNTEQISALNTMSNVTHTNETNSTTKGPYPSANYDNQLINSFTLTTNAPPVQNSQFLPPIEDNRWQNFTLRANLSIVMPDVNINTTMTNGQQNNTVPLYFSKENGTNYSEWSKGPYPSASYNNEGVDQLQITTNYYTNESPSQTNDGWGSYSPMNTLPSGFRPLAGLYYDGYLHVPVKKYGFMPQNYWH